MALRMGDKYLTDTFRKTKTDQNHIREEQVLNPVLPNLLKHLLLCNAEPLNR